jgi:hypothetical protein
MLTAAFGQAEDDITINTDEACDLADTAALGQVAEDVEDLLFGQVGAEERRPLAFGEAVLAGVTVKQAGVLLAVACADREVARVALAVERAVGVLAAEARKIVPGRESSEVLARDVVRQCDGDASPILRPSLT